MISDILKPLADAPQQAYMSDLLQVADIMQWILGQTGPADIVLTSFSISEEFLRRLFFLEKSGLVRSLDIVLDFKATHKTLVLWPFIAQTVRNCHLASNHSKLLLVGNDSWTVSAVMSQNLTRGNRFESGFLSTSPDVYRVLKKQTDDLIKFKSVPFHEIFRKTVDGH